MTCATARRASRIPNNLLARSVSEEEQATSLTLRASGRRRWRLLAVALLAAGLILCHGCHGGDHDDELIVWLFDR